MFGLPESTIDSIHSVFVRYPQVEQAVLYGSRATDNYKNGSDIDLTLQGGDACAPIMGRFPIPNFRR